MASYLLGSCCDGLQPDGDISEYYCEDASNPFNEASAGAVWCEVIDANHTCDFVPGYFCPGMIPAVKISSESCCDGLQPNGDISEYSCEDGSNPFNEAAAGDVWCDAINANHTCDFVPGYFCPGMIPAVKSECINAVCVVFGYPMCASGNSPIDIRPAGDCCPIWECERKSYSSYHICLYDKEFRSTFVTFLKKRGNF